MNVLAGVDVYAPVVHSLWICANLSIVCVK